jgi:hypothetical protein
MCSDEDFSDIIITGAVRQIVVEAASEAGGDLEGLAGFFLFFKVHTYIYILCVPLS